MQIMAYGSNSIPPEDARRLIAAHDGNIALLYIWQSVNGRFNAEDAARDLCMTAGEVSVAKEKLDRLFSSGVPAAAQDPVPDEKKVSLPETKPPSYPPEDVRTVLDSAPDFKSVVDEAARTLGRPLSTLDISTLLAIYDHLGMPAEVMMELIHYCHEVSRERFGPSRRLSFSSIYKEAARWAEEGILSFEAAETYIADQKQLRGRIAQVASVLNLDAARLTDTPVKYIRSWVAMGFEDPAISEAYDRTFSNTGKLQWSYMDVILKKWHSAGLHSIREIRENDPRRGQKNTQAPKGSSVDIKAVADLLNDSKNKEG